MLLASGEQTGSASCFMYAVWWSFMGPNRPRLDIKTAFPGIWIYTRNLRRPWDRLIFIIRIPILTRRHFLYWDPPPTQCLLIKKTFKLFLARCEANLPISWEFPSQGVSNAESDVITRSGNPNRSFTAPSLILPMRGKWSQVYHVLWFSKCSCYSNGGTVNHLLRLV